MMILDPFALPGRFYKGNLHTHSNRSDGALEVEAVCSAYRAAGYDFIALTDHFLHRYGHPIVDTRALRDDRFTTIIGAELHLPATALGETWHILAVGLPLDFAPPSDGETASAIARRAREAGAFVTIVHPAWYGLTAEDAAMIPDAHAIEVYNHTSAVKTDRGDGTALFDQLLAQGRRITACATDDAHFSEPDHFGGWVMVKAEANEPEALLAALKAGHFYSTQGPELRDVRVEDGHLIVESSAVVSVVALGHGTGAKAVHGHSMTRAEVPLDRVLNSPWIRAAVIDAAGKRAWSNPIWVGAHGKNPRVAG